MGPATDPLLCTPEPIAKSPGRPLRKQWPVCFYAPQRLSRQRSCRLPVAVPVTTTAQVDRLHLPEQLVGMLAPDRRQLPLRLLQSVQMRGIVIQLLLPDRDDAVELK